MASPLNRHLRAFGPSVVLAAGSVLAFLKLRSAAQSPLVAPLLETMTWLPLATYLLAACWAFTSAVRLWRWEAGNGPTCPRCGGFQGMVRAGRYGRPDYRTCFDCGRHAAAGE
jgi:hypothetical protein